jgi:hypothetical protein
MFTAANDNAPPRVRPVLLVGTVSDGGVVTITDPDWRPTPRPPTAPFPSDPREA